MKTVTVSEFRNNIKMYLDIAKEEKVIINRGKAGSFAIVPIEETGDEPYSTEYIESVLKGDKEYKNGKCVTIALGDLWK